MTVIINYGLLFLILWQSGPVVAAFSTRLPRNNIRPPENRKSTTLLNLWNKLDQVMDKMVLQTLFPEPENVQAVNPHETLECFDLEALPRDNPMQIQSALTSLTNFLQLWARELELNPDKGLTTPITASDFRNSTPAAVEHALLDHDNAIQNVSMKLTFRPPKRYLSYKEQKSMEKGVLPDRKGAKVDAWSPGGLQLHVLLVQPEECDSIPPMWQLKLEVQRCDIDGDTVIKFASERAIVRRLREAVRIWTKVRAMP